MIGAFGDIQVLGWGAARVFGRSPSETADRVVPDCCSDVFSLGEILRTIFTGDGATERLDGSGFVALANQCLRPDPADRPTDASAVAKLIAELRRA
jgi:hypothetical protein